MATKPTQSLGEGKAQKKNKNDRRSRRALREIGNLNPAQGIEIKVPPQRPVTRSFWAHLVANAQQDPGPSSNGCQRETTTQTERREGNELAIDRGREPRLSPNRRPTRAYSSILAERRRLVVDIDEADSHNELAVVEYVDDMFRFYRETEGESKPTNYMESQPELSPRMRAILVDWIVEVHRNFGLTPEALYLTVNIMDRVLSSMAIRRADLQLVGMGAMLIATKYEEIYAPSVDDLVALCDRAYNQGEVLVMEKRILGALGWTLTVPTALVFLARFVKASLADRASENMAHYLAELGLMSYEITAGYSHSVFAAAAVYVARCTMGRVPVWTETLRRYTGYEERELRECAVALAEMHANAARDGRLRAVSRKYSRMEGAVVSYPPARLHFRQ